MTRSVRLFRNASFAAPVQGKAFDTDQRLNDNGARGGRAVPTAKPTDRTRVMTTPMPASGGLPVDNCFAGTSGS
jgi:hypothetical protein